MVQVLKLQLHIMHKSWTFRISMLVMLLFSVMTFIQQWTTAAQYDANANWCGVGYSLSWSVFASVIFPFLIVFANATSFVSDLHQGVFTNVICRKKQKDYFRAKLMTVFVCNCLLIAIPFGLNLLLCNLFFEHNGNTLRGQMGSVGYRNILHGTKLLYKTYTPKVPFLKLCEASPLAYNIVFILIAAVFAGILGMFVMAVSFMIRHYTLVLFVPVYLMMKFSEVLTSYYYNQAIYHGKKFLNWTLTDYIAPLSFNGKFYPYFIFVNMLLLVFICLICKSAEKQDLLHWQQEAD